jgi:hypothetical protein
MLLWLKKIMDSGTRTEVCGTARIVVLRVTYTLGDAFKSIGMMRIMSARKACTDSVSERDRLLVTVSDPDAELDSDGDKVGERETLELGDAETLSELDSDSERERDSDHDSDAEAVGDKERESEGDSEADGDEETVYD